MATESQAEAAAPAPDSDCCPICLADYRAPCRTPCGHVYCAECLLSTLHSWGAGKCPLCRQGVSVYSTIGVADDVPLRMPDVSTIFGLVFVQGGHAGVASYHFASPDDCWISYADAPEEWKLDDGSRPMPKKPFTAVAFDAATRTFHGTVLWEEATFDGASRWEYMMVFSEDYNLIVGGQMQEFGPDGAARDTHRFPTQLVYWRQRPSPTTLGGCTFVQGGTVGLASYHFPTDHFDELPYEQLEAPYISYEVAPPFWSQDDGSAMPRKKPFINASYDGATRTFRGTIHWEPPLHGEARWEYEMHFDEQFETIAGGQVRAFDAQGAETQQHTFGVDLSYVRLVEERQQMAALLETLSADEASHTRE